MSQQPSVCPHCRAYNHAAKCCIPHSTRSISSLAATPSVVVLQHLNLLVCCQKGCFLLYLEEQSSSSWSLIYWALGSHAKVSSKDRNPVGKSFPSLCLKRWFKLSNPALGNSFWPQNFCSCAHLNVSLTLYIYTVQVLSFAVGIYGGSSTINAFFPALFITHYWQTPYLSFLKGRGALQYNSSMAALGMLE